MKASGKRIKGIAALALTFAFTSAMLIPALAATTGQPGYVPKESSEVIGPWMISSGTDNSQSPANGVNSGTNIVSQTTPADNAISISDAPGSVSDTTSTAASAAVSNGPGSDVSASGSAADTQSPSVNAAGADTGSSSTSASASGSSTGASGSYDENGLLHDSNNYNLVYSNGRWVDISKPMVALTFDDGPKADVGNHIMDLMEANNGRATFFMVGSRVASYEIEVNRMVANGHEVANHTYDHKYLNKCDAATIRSQVTSCNDIIQKTCGIRPIVMRLPGGNKNSTVLQNVNMPIILWNIDTRDWDHRNAQKSVNAVVGKVKDGDIVLMHELYTPTGTACETIIPTLASQGFQLVTVSEMAMLKNIKLEPNKIYYSFN